ncbi:amidase [candidate division KSB1 bacterium]|nr:MAG: amidase [candidate division KSB1 bacterium]
MDRRSFVSYFSAAGLSTSLFPGVLYAIAQGNQEEKITKEMVMQAEKITGLSFTDAEREMMLNGLNRRLKSYKKIRKIRLDNSVPPAINFTPVLPDMEFEKEKKPFKLDDYPDVKIPTNIEEIAFYPVVYLAQLIKSRKISSVELTGIYLRRLKRYGSKLKCVITLTEELAMRQAKKADEEIKNGKYKGPLHGIPWGAKDLLATKGIKTTWGAKPYKNQIIDEDATVVRRLKKSGAVLVAKLSMGALAMGDVWFGGKTRNPWNIKQGSSGSSAGSAAATSAGLVGFAIGTETLGSIISPSTRCGVTGLRPTFGRVSRYGAMALSWSMDKIGPICRCVEDCAVVFNAIYGPDGKDGTVVDVPFNWRPDVKVTDLKIGYLKTEFEKDRRNRKNNSRTLEKLHDMGIDLIPVKLPDYPVNDISFILSAEAAAAFDELTRSNRDDLLVRQTRGAWPNSFRTSRFIPAVEYIQANRIRTLLMKAMAEMMSEIDVYVAPSFGKNLLVTNLTGHPAVVVPNGFDEKGNPTSITFTGNLYEEDKVLLVAKAYQETTDFHLKHPEV